MKTVSKTMYIIGRVVNIVEIVLCALMFIPGVILLAAADYFASLADSKSDAFAIRAVGIGFLIGFGIALAVLVVVLILANRASKALDNEVKEKAPHIVMIFIGWFGVIFYTLGGIFGLIAENGQNEEPATIERSEFAEEPIEATEVGGSPED